MRKVYFNNAEYQEFKIIKSNDTGFLLDNVTYPNLFKKVMDAEMGPKFADDLAYAINNPESIEVTDENSFTSNSVDLDEKGYAVLLETDQFLAWNPHGNVVLMDEPQELEGYDLMFSIKDLIGLDVLEYVNFISEDELFLGEVFEVPQLQFNEFIDLRNRHPTVEDAIEEILMKAKGTWFTSFAHTEVTVDEFISIWNGEIGLSPYWT